MKLYFRQYQNLTISGIYETSVEFSNWGATQNCKDYEVDTDAGTTRLIIQPKNGWLCKADVEEYFRNNELVGSVDTKRSNGNYVFWIYGHGHFNASTRVLAMKLIEKFWA